MISKSAVIAIAAALQVSAGAMQAQSSENPPVKVTARRVIEAPSPTTWIDRYVSMLSVGAQQGRVPLSQQDARARLSAMRAKADSLRVRLASLMPSRRPECPMPVAKKDSSQVAAMKVVPRDSGPSSPWAVSGRLSGCTNPLADNP